MIPSQQNVQVETPPSLGQGGILLIASALRKQQNQGVIGKFIKPDIYYKDRVGPGFSHRLFGY